MKFFIIPHLRKNPHKIVLHVGTNDTPRATPKEMFNAIKNLKSFIQTTPLRVKDNYFHTSVRS